MSRLSDLRTVLIEDRVTQLADHLRKHRMQARNLAVLLHEECDATLIKRAVPETVCGLCGLKYVEHPQVLGDYVLCNGLVVQF